ncbi:MAG: hypothetical protein U0353_13740 [Sandaracinus sp.]
MPRPRVSGCSAYIVAAWPPLDLALVVANGEACLMRASGGVVSWVPVERG